MKTASVNLRGRGQNLLKPEWAGLDSSDLRLLLDARIGGPGQYSGQPGDAGRLFLPRADESCRVILRFEGNRISVIQPGKGFDQAQWAQVSAEIDTQLLVGPIEVGRDVSFSSFRVSGWWRGRASGVQIRRMPKNAPASPVHGGLHPFVLEFPLQVAPEYQIWNGRRLREHRKLTLLLNVLLRGSITIQPIQSEHFWAVVAWRKKPVVKVVQRAYFANIGRIRQPKLSRPLGDRLEEIEPAEYYSMRGNDGRGMRLPADLDESIVRYRNLTPSDREKFDRALYWMDVASSQWTISMSASFASLVSAIESLTDRGAIHSVYCKQCREYRDHDVPGPTAQFRNFFETYSPGQSLKKRRNDMYRMRSGILHGSHLIAFDEGLAHGWDPPWNEQRELHAELWQLSQVALRSWLRKASTDLRP